MDSRYEPTELDIKWAEQEAYNWMYSQGFAKSADWTPEQDKDEHHVVTMVLLFGLQRLGVHVDRKTDQPNPAAYANPGQFPTESTTINNIARGCCKYGYDYALHHIPVEVD